MTGQTDFFILQTVEVGLVGLFSVVSVCIYSIILWTYFTSRASEEEDRWSFRRSVKALTLAAIIQNIFTIVFLIAETTNSFKLFENELNVETLMGLAEALDQYLYCVFVYMTVLCLVKPLVWPRLKFDSYIYIITLIPPSLNMIIRLTMIFTIIPNHATQSAINIATDVITSFIIYHLPFTVAVISSITTSRRQPEHFLKLSCQRMGIIFSVHLAVSGLQFSLYAFLQCHSYDWDMSLHQYTCSDHLWADTFSQTSSSTSRPPDNPATLPTPTNVTLIVLNVISQLLLPFIPASFLYTVRTILQE